MGYRFRKLERLLPAAMLLVLVFVSTAGCGDTGPSATAEDFIKAAFENDCEAMFENSSSESLGGQSREEAIRECENSEQLSQLFGAIGEVKLEDFETLNEDISVSGDKAEVTARLKLKIGDSEESVEQTFHLVKEGDEWKIDL